MRKIKKLLPILMGIIFTLPISVQAEEISDFNPAEEATQISHIQPMNKVTDSSNQQTDLSQDNNSEEVDVTHTDNAEDSSVDAA